MTGPPLTYRRMDPQLDGEVAFESYREACIASFGSAAGCLSRSHYLRWLAKRVEEFPDGHVIAGIGEHFVGQLELQVPYGLKTGYVTLFFVAPAWRRMGMGRRLHGFAERYFRSWEADRIDLHVAPTNIAAVNLYRSLGYRYLTEADRAQRTRKMQLSLEVRVG